MIHVVWLRVLTALVGLGGGFAGGKAAEAAAPTPTGNTTHDVIIIVASGVMAILTGISVPIVTKVMDNRGKLVEMQKKIAELEAAQKTTPRKRTRRVATQED